jgi:hypothetical protein
MKLSVLHVYASPRLCVCVSVCLCVSVCIGSQISNDESNDEHVMAWVPNEVATHCRACQCPFSFLTRRHHCRNWYACIHPSAPRWAGCAVMFIDTSVYADNSVVVSIACLVAQFFPRINVVVFPCFSGQVFCGECSAQRCIVASIAHKDPVRVCVACSDDISKRMADERAFSIATFEF